MAKAAAKAQVGHNSGDMSERDRKVLFFVQRRRYLAALEKKKAADAALKLVGKGIKVDLGEHGLVKIKAYEKALTPEGQEELQARLQAEAEAMRWRGVAIGTQLDLLEDRTPLIERAAAEGEEAGLRGDTLSNPYGEESEAGQAYSEAWTKGQIALFAGIKAKEEAEASTDELIAGADVDEDPFADAAE